MVDGASGHFTNGLIIIIINVLLSQRASIEYISRVVKETLSSYIFMWIFNYYYQREKKTLLSLKPLLILA